VTGARRADHPRARVAGQASGQTPLDEAMALLIDLLAAIQDPAPAGSTTGDRTLDGQLRHWAHSQERPDTAPRAATAAILIWTRIHGIVGLELTGIFDNRTVEAQRLIDLEIDNAIHSLSAPVAVNRSRFPDGSRTCSTSAESSCG
jgi:hypothetical protein